jgi:hypothetical protein
MVRTGALFFSHSAILGFMRHVHCDFLRAHHFFRFDLLVHSENNIVTHYFLCDSLLGLRTPPGPLIFYCNFYNNGLHRFLASFYILQYRVVLDYEPHYTLTFGLVWFGLVWFGLVWFGLVWFG